MNQKEECITGICFWARDLNRAQGEVLMEYKYKLYDFLTHDFYFQKHVKGNMDKIQELVSETKKRLAREKAESRLSRSTLYDILAVGEKFGTQEELTEALQKKNLPVQWSSALTLLGRDSKVQDLEGSIYKCSHKCPIHK